MTSSHPEIVFVHSFNILEYILSGLDILMGLNILKIIFFSTWNSISRLELFLLITKSRITLLEGIFAFSSIFKLGDTFAKVM